MLQSHWSMLQVTYIVYKTIVHVYVLDGPSTSDLSQLSNNEIEVNFQCPALVNDSKPCDPLQLVQSLPQRVPGQGPWGVCALHSCITNTVSW